MPQEIPENAADLAHLAHLHAPGMPSGVDLRYINSKKWKFLRHDWKVSVRFPPKRPRRSPSQTAGECD